MQSGAVLSTCGKYRYSLTRERLGGDGTVVFVMLNPSTADASIDDPTIRRCIGFAKAWRYAALEVVNLYAYRATNPLVMFDAADPVGPDNDRHIAAAAERASFIVAAWGSNARPDRVATVSALIKRDVHALGLNANGAPRHPLYVRADAQPIRWPA